MSDEDSRIGLIRLRVRDLGQLFNTLDPDPLHERDLDTGASAYIVSWAREVPRHVPLRLRIEIAQPKAGQSIEHVVQGIRNYFAQGADLARNELRQLLRRGRLSLVIGLVMLAFTHIGGYLLGEVAGPSPGTSLVREGLLIGGWVAMWRPLDILLYEWWPIRRKRLDFARMQAMPIDVLMLDPPKSA